MAPCCIVCFFQVEENSEHMLFHCKGFPYVSFESDVVVESAVSFSESGLVFTEDVVFFQIPYEPVVDHALHRFTEAAGKGYGSVAVGVCGWFAGFGEWEYSGLLP